MRKLIYLCVKMAKAGTNMIQITDDIAMQNSLMMSPDIWRKFDKPRLANLIKEVKNTNKDTYMFIHFQLFLHNLFDLKQYHTTQYFLLHVYLFQCIPNLHLHIF